MRVLFETTDETLCELDTTAPGPGDMVRLRDRMYSVAKVCFLYDPTTDTHQAFVLLAEIPRHWWKGLEEE